MNHSQKISRLNDLSEADIRDRLCRLSHESRPEPIPEYPSLPDVVRSKPRKAAVLIPLVAHRRGWHLLLTRRNEALPEHSGQVAFPGGGTDPTDGSAEQTALREASEEIGLAPHDVLVLGQLAEYWTVSNYWVTPVVGRIPWPYPLKLARAEVERAFTIPLTWLADPANYEVRRRELPDPHSFVDVVYYKSYCGEVLWGASARFVLALIDVLMDNSKTS